MISKSQTVMIVPWRIRGISSTDQIDPVFPFTNHYSPSLNKKTPSQQGRRWLRRGTTLLPDALTSPDSLGRDNERTSSSVTVFHRRHLSF